VRAGFEQGIPAGRYGDPDELGAYVAWLCSEPARYQTGTFVAIDGGALRALP
jgi:3-oxoacyl-[acyl-carrier protein] reductase